MNDSASPSKPRRLNVLLVDDDDADIVLVERAFAQDRCVPEIHVVNDGLEAMWFLRRQGEFADAPRPDLILLDLNLPRKTVAKSLSKSRVIRVSAAFPCRADRFQLRSRRRRYVRLAGQLLRDEAGRLGTVHSHRRKRSSNSGAPWRNYHRRSPTRRQLTTFRSTARFRPRFKATSAPRLLLPNVAARQQELPLGFKGVEAPPQLHPKRGVLCCFFATFAPHNREIHTFI